MGERVTGSMESGSPPFRVLVACAMVEDEVRAAQEHCGVSLPTIWVDRGHHEKPDVLRVKLQESIGEAEAMGADEVLLAFGLCGCGTVGLHADHAVLAMPRFDDCVNLMLFTGERTARGYAQAGVMYLTRGWAHDATLITGQWELYRRKYGERRANRLMEGMYGSYRAVSLIDNGCYDIADVRGYACQCANTLGVDMRVDTGSNIALEKLVSGRWDEDILVYRPGSSVLQEDFDWS